MQLQLLSEVKSRVHLPVQHLVHLHKYYDEHLQLHLNTYIQVYQKLHL